MLRRDHTKKKETPLPKKAPYLLLMRAFSKVPLHFRLRTEIKLSKPEVSRELKWSKKR